jgi:hypothetical protein
MVGQCRWRTVDESSEHLDNLGHDWLVPYVSDIRLNCNGYLGPTRHSRQIQYCNASGIDGIRCGVFRSCNSARQVADSLKKLSQQYTVETRAHFPPSPRTNRPRFRLKASPNEVSSTRGSSSGRYGRRERLSSQSDIDNRPSFLEMPHCLLRTKVGATRGLSIFTAAHGACQAIGSEFRISVVIRLPARARRFGWIGECRSRLFGRSEFAR